MKSVLLSLLSCTFLLPACAFAQTNDEWKFEFMPYAWLAGIDGDVTVRDKTAEVDVGFDDLLDTVDFAGSFLLVARQDRLVFWEQFDYMELDSDNLSNSPDIASVKSKSLFSTSAVGYQFDGFGNSKIDVMAGLRYAHMDNALHLPESVRKRSADLFDAVLVLRPDFEILEWLHFNPTMSVGAGDSDLTYELQPQLQFRLGKSTVARLGYRRLFYDVENNGVKFDGAIHGLIAGVGFIF